MPSGGLYEKLPRSFPRQHTYEAAKRVIHVLIDPNIFAVARSPFAGLAAPRSI
jgi:hypothetical protein